MQAFLGKLAAGLGLAGAALTLATALLTVLSVLGRWLWAKPIQGDVELTQAGIAVGIALCLPWCQLQRANIIVDFFTLKSPARVRGAMDSVGALLLAAMVGVLAWRAGVGGFAAKESGETTIILGVPMWILYAALAPGFAVTAVIAVWQAFWQRDEGGSAP